MDGDVVVLVLAAENNGAQCLVGLQGLRKGLSSSWAQGVAKDMELRSKQKSHLSRRFERRQSS